MGATFDEVGYDIKEVAVLDIDAALARLHVTAVPAPILDAACSPEPSLLR